MSHAAPKMDVRELVQFQTLYTSIPDNRRSSQAGVRALLAQGIGAAKAGEQEEAFFHLSRVLRTDVMETDRVQAWLWLSQVVADPADKRFCLEQVLALDSVHGLARRGLAVLDGRLNPDEIVNPDTLAQQLSDEPVTAEVEQFVCPQCTGRMNYTPDRAALVCEFCLYRLVVDEHGRVAVEPQFGQGEFEQEFTIALATAKGHLQPMQVRAFLCHNCAVEFVLAPETLSVTCPYCDAVYVTETAESRDLAPPQALIPFQLTLDDVKRALRQWFQKHRLEKPRVSPIVGIYLPVWTFDIGGEVKWSGMVKRGDDYVPISGSYMPFFDDVLVPASTKLAESVTKGMREFDLTQLVAYDARYLADWPAERYQIALADASLLGRKQVLQQMRRQPNKLTGGEVVSNLRLNTNNLIVESYKQLLLPMWVAHYRLEGQVYDVAVNGQTGVVHGDKPRGGVGKFFARLLGG
jgi:hypothetical protein